MRKTSAPALCLLFTVLLASCDQGAGTEFVEHFQNANYPTVNFTMSSQIACSYVNQSTPTTAAGSMLDSSYVGSAGTYSRDTYFYFDIAAAIPRRAHVTRAVLKLRNVVITDSNTSTPFTVTAHPCTARWDYYYVTWNSGRTLLDTSRTLGSANIAYSDFTVADRILEIPLNKGIVESWLDQGQNFGFALIGGDKSETNSYISFLGHTYSTASARPLLIVYYTMD